MKIRFEGKPFNIAFPEVKYLFDFYGRILFGKLSNTLIIHCKYCNFCDGTSGQVTPIDYDERNNNHREFFLTLEKDLSYHEHLRVIAHEMEHIRQYARGELTCFSYNLMRWKNGLTYRLTDDTYPFVPWEKEAKRSEGWLVYFYEEHCRNNNLYFKNDSHMRR